MTNFWMIGMILWQLAASVHYAVQTKWLVCFLLFTYALGNVLIYMIGERM